ncbi:MAG TPA: hypothetical protein VFT59_04555 [Candidatus Saccharimonadales bacterium]|nr:hypothetical protein [Candidatus Saccharimonadales bacterium]
MLSFVQICQVFQDRRTGICNRIEIDGVSTNRERESYLREVMEIGVREEAEKPYYYLHALFVKLPDETWQHIAIWDFQHGWYPAVNQYLA